MSVQQSGYLSEQGYCRIQQILALLPISRSAWWAGVKAGKYPKPVKLGARTTAWRNADIIALLASYAREDGEGQK